MDLISESKEKFDQHREGFKTIEGKKDKLTDAELKQKLKGLKNYETWKRTRMQKISLEEITKANESPIIQIAKACGIKNGQNVMLNEFVQGYDISKLVHPQKMNEFQKLLSNYDPMKSVIEMKNKLIGNKAKIREKQKIKKIVDVLDRKYKKLNQRQVKTQPSLELQDKYTFDKIVKNRSVFKQIRKLNKLALLPIVCENIPDCVKSSSNPQILQINNRSIIKTDQQSLLIKNSNTVFLTNDSKKEGYLKQILTQKSIQKSKKGYIKDIKHILNKSDELLKEQFKYQSKDRGGKRYSKVTEMNSQGMTQEMMPQKGKRYQHWPNYQRYSISATDSKNLSLAYSHLADFKANQNNIPEQLNEMINKVKLQFKQQQKHIDQEIIQNQKNSLDLRYCYKIKMERENYLRNVEELAKCKREYRIEKDRQQVKANGITRVARDKPMKMIKKLKTEQTDVDSN